jgi:DNA-binding NtrC family response regulator
VLIVDDDANILRLFAKILSRGGYEVHTEPSSAKVFGVLDTEGPFDLLILDLCMPEPDGFEVMKEVRSRYPALKVLITSGFLEGKLLQASQYLGATETLSKTDAPMMLLSQVNHLLQCQ